MAARRQLCLALRLELLLRMYRSSDVACSGVFRLYRMFRPCPTLGASARVTADRRSRRAVRACSLPGSNVRHGLLEHQILFDREAIRFDSIDNIRGFCVAVLVDLRQRSGYPLNAEPPRERWPRLPNIPQGDEGER